MFAEAVGFALAAAGFRVRAFDNPKAALAEFLDATPKPDLLVTDNAMPEMNGWELVRQCRAAHPRLKAVSASGSLATSPPPADIRMDGVIEKPFSATELVKLVRTVVAK